MPTPQLQLADFMDLFSGNIHNFGQHIYVFSKSGKEQGKNLTITNKLLTVEQYQAHLNGEMGLGVIPINESGLCKFAAIDIDVYDEDLARYIKAIEHNNFPLVPFRSKSGGLHLFLFLKQAVNAKLAIELLQLMSSTLGLDIYIKNKLNKMIEIFPKQHKLVQGSIGNWINIPYYNAKTTNQYAIRDDKKLDLDNALAYIKEKRRTLSELRNFIADLAYSDGPPCLQTINMLGTLNKGGGRNNFLFAFGVYLKKKEPEFWEQKLFDINISLNDPLSRQELEATIISSLRKKEYTYRCLEQPIVDFCRKSLCKARTFGIGKEGGYFSDLEYGKLCQIKAYEPYYEWEVKTQGTDNFKLLRFNNEEEIIRQDVFLRLCFRELHVLPIRMKQSEWFKIINQALNEIVIKIVEIEDDTSPISLLKSLMLEFLFDRAPAQSREQILNRRVFHDIKNKRYIFRVCDLIEFLFISKNFRYFLPSQIHGILRDYNARPNRIKSESGKQFRIYEISEIDANNMNTLGTADLKATFEKEETAF